MLRKIRRSIALACFFLAAAFANGDTVAPGGKNIDLLPRAGTALLITGAAARIPQEAALLQALAARGLLDDLVFISGDSSGALNAVALNAILSGRMSWQRYREILASVRTGDIFVRKGKLIPVDTSPLRALLIRVVSGEMGYLNVGDLPIPTSISITGVEDLGIEKQAYRISNQKINSESDPSLSLVDVLMASTSFPVVFPSVRIPGATTLPNVAFVDGGAGPDYIPWQALAEFEQARGQGVARIFVVSRKNDRIPEISEELRDLGVNDHGLFDKMGISLDQIASRVLEKQLRIYAERSPELAARTYVWKPDFQGRFLLFDFNNLEAQYAATESWAATNEPIPLDQYLVAHAKD